jgi:hypothetical protein
MMIAISIGLGIRGCSRRAGCWNLNEPSDSLRQAIQLMDDVVSKTAATSDHLDAILAAVSDAGADDALTGLVRRVLLAALELREGRRWREEDHRGT